LLLVDFDLLVIGEINLDLVLSGEDVSPEFGQKEKVIADAQLTLGSSSAIFACQAARLGLRTAFAGVVGADLFGGQALQSLSERGVDTRACISDPSLKTGVSVILVRRAAESRGVPGRGGGRPDADRAILTYPGAIGALRADQIDRALFTRARHLHIASYFLLDALRPDLPKLLREAKQAGMTVSLDTNWDPAERWDLTDILDYCDVFLPNEAELLAIAPHSPAPEPAFGVRWGPLEPDVETALARLQRRADVIAVKRGARGALAVHGGARAECPARPVQVVDTVGAGDSFDAGFVYGYLHDWSLPDTLKLACACGSLSTRSVGGTTSQPTLEEALASS
jgi:sugar/nucleoside kinase (ribokinase family)